MFMKFPQILYPIESNSWLTFFFLTGTLSLMALPMKMRVRKQSQRSCFYLKVLML